jgi:hypothetical protein
MSAAAYSSENCDPSAQETEEGGWPQSFLTPREPIEAAENRQAAAISRFERSVRDMIGRIDAVEQEQAYAAAPPDQPIAEPSDSTGRHAGGAHGAATVTQLILAVERDQVAQGVRLESALQDLRDDSRRFGRRFDGLEGEQAAADARLVSLELEQTRLAARAESALQEIKKEEAVLAGRIEAAERRQTDSARRLGEAIEEARNKAAGLTEKVHQLTDRPAAAEARFSAFEEAAARATVEAQDAERKTDAAVFELAVRIDRITAAEQASLIAMRELRNACEAVDERLGLSERSARENQARASEDLTMRLEAAHHQFGRELISAGARLERLEQTLAERLQTTDARSSSAIERIGAEVLEVAQALGHRLSALEGGAAEAHGSESQLEISADQRSERTTAALVDRIRQSEARAERILQETSRDIEQGVAKAEALLAAEALDGPSPPQGETEWVAADPNVGLGLDELLGLHSGQDNPAAAEVGPSPAPESVVVRSFLRRRLARLRQSPPQQPSPLSTGRSGALMAASVMAIMGFSAGAYVLLDGEPALRAPESPRAQIAAVGHAGAISTAAPVQPIAALAIEPTFAPDATVAAQSAKLYQSAMAEVSIGKAGMAAMRRLAEGGYSPAQAYLAKLSVGGSGPVGRGAPATPGRQ